MAYKHMTLDDLAASTKPYFTVNDVCGVLGTNPHTIRLAAREQPELLGFEVVVLKSRIVIPRIPFLRKMGVDI